MADIVCHLLTCACAVESLFTGRPFMYSPKLPTMINNVKLNVFGVLNLKADVDSIGIDTSGEYLYFAPTNALSLYRIETKHLRDFSLNNLQLEALVRPAVAQRSANCKLSAKIVVSLANDPLSRYQPKNKAFILLFFAIS